MYSVVTTNIDDSTEPENGGVYITHKKALGQRQRQTNNQYYYYNGRSAYLI